jgi:hypothetical protein
VKKMQQQTSFSADARGTATQVVFLISDHKEKLLSVGD